jgi:hypothetical protein
MLEGSPHEKISPPSMKVVTFKSEGSPNEKNFITMNESSYFQVRRQKE